MKESPVSKLGLLFINNFRVTILSFVVILLGGFLAYTTFLPRKGFPALEFPIVLVQTSYEVGDVEKVNNDITEPIEFALSNLEGVNTVQTTTTPGFNLAIVSFETGYSSTEQAKEIQNIFKEGIGLPANITPVVSPIVSGTFDGENELVLGLVGDNGQTVADLEAKAEVIAESLNDLSQVKKASVIKQINDVYEPRTGKTHSEQTAFNRYGVKENEKVNFKQSVLIGIKNNNSYTITEISDAIHKKVEDLEDAGELEGFEVVSVYDQAEDLNEQINSLEINAIAAILGVIAVCLLFVHWRAALITAIFIPGVMAGTFVVMLLGGMSLNVISLFGLILVLGLLVDDAIVVVEAIVLAKQEGLKGKKAIVKAINSVGKSDVVGTLTVILVFFPMLFIVGILGEIVKDIPITIIITLSVSLVLALTVIPYFCYKFIVDEDKNAKKNIVSRVLEYPNELVQLASKYVARFVNFYLSKWYLTALMIVISIVLIFSGLFFASISKVANFAAEKDSNGVQAVINYDPTSTLAEREQVAKDFEASLIENYGDVVEKITYPFVGVDSNTGMQVAYVFVDLTPLGDRDITSIEIAKSLDEKVANVKNATIAVSPITNGGPPSDEYASKIQIYAEDNETLLELGHDIQEFMKTLELPKDATVEDTKIDNLDILVKNNGRRYAQVSSKLSEEGDDSVVAFIDAKVREKFDKEKLNSLGLPQDALDTDKGFQEEFTKSVISAVVALGVAFVFMYFFMVITFNSFGRALLVMTALPFTFFGLFGGLYATDNAISFFVIIGIIALTGIVVNNTIMLLEFANQERERGKSIKVAIVDAVRIRFRPLVTTSATTLVGMLPLAITEPFWESLAFAIAFGLMSSTIMVIFIFPAYYYVMENVRMKKSRLVLKLRR